MGLLDVERSSTMRQAVLLQYQILKDKRTERQTHSDIRARSSSCGKN